MEEEISAQSQTKEEVFEKEGFTVECIFSYFFMSYLWYG